MQNKYLGIALLLIGFIYQPYLVCFGQGNQDTPLAVSLSESLELEAYQHEKAGERTLTKVSYGQAITERTKAGFPVNTAEGAGQLIHYLYYPFDEVLKQGKSFIVTGQLSKAGELYAKTLKQLNARQASTASARRLEQQLYLIDAASNKKNAEQLLRDFLSKVLVEWGPYSDLYTSLLYEQIQYYDQTQKLPLLSDALNKMNAVLRQRQQNLAAFLLNDFEYDTFLALHQRYTNQLLSVCVKYHNSLPELERIVADYLLVSRNLQLNGQRIIREQFIVKLLGDAFVAVGMSFGIPYLKETVKKTAPGSKEHEEALADISRRQEIVRQLNAKARRNNLYNDWAAAKQKESSDRDKFVKLESQLIDSLDRFLEQLVIIDPQTVVSKLKTDNAIVDFFTYQAGLDYSKTMYGAIVYSKSLQKPTLVSLSSQEEIYQLIVKQKRGASASDEVLANSINQLYVSPALYELIWKPLIPTLNGIQYLDYLPVDLLNAVALDALVANANGKPICEQFVSRRILTIPTSFAKAVLLKPDQLVEEQLNADFWGSITYDKKADRMPVNAESTGAAVAIRGAITTLTRGGSWSQLSGSGEEISKAGNILKVLKPRSFNTYTKTKATEHQFKYQYTNLVHPHILHIATHGFYDDMSIQESTGEINKLSSQSNGMMLKAGLVFAGANTKPEPGQEDGILTGLEISRLNLNSKLVILSACESGLGTQKSNEGIFGLQRAFKQAGADYILMTLWEIPDKETVDIMESFYTNISKGQPVDVAFRNTQLSMKAKYLPYVWASFVLLR